MLMNLRNALMAGKRLPYDAEVEYLESTGMQWIDTGIVPTTDTSCNLVFSVTALDSTYRTPLSVRSWDGAADSFTISSGTTSDNTFAFGTRFWTASNNLPIPSVGEVYLATLKSGLATLGGKSGNAGVLITPSGLTAYLFARNSNGTASNFLKGRIYSCKIWQSGTLVRDFIPVRKGTVGAIYDRRGVGGMNPDGSPRNDGMYYNRGTGDFVLGNDK